MYITTQHIIFKLLTNVFKDVYNYATYNIIAVNKLIQRCI